MTRGPITATPMMEETDDIKTKMTKQEEVPTSQKEAVYSGRWTLDEEQYAECLMEEFRAGNIPDLENGATLRNYIAQMLSCPPKRITKKYERTAYNGKLTYCGNIVAMTDEEALRRQEHVKELRTKFLTSRKQRLLGKPYQKPRPKQKIPYVFKPAGAADSQEPLGRPAHGSVPPGAREGLTAALIGVQGTGGLMSNSLLQQSAAARAGLPFASLTGAGGMLGLGGTLDDGLLEQLLLQRSVQRSIQNPLLATRGVSNLLLNQALGGGGLVPPGSNPLFAQDLARQQLIAEIQRENELNNMLQQAVTSQRTQHPVVGPEEFDLASQIRAGQKRDKPDSDVQLPCPPEKRKKDP